MANGKHMTAAARLVLPDAPQELRGPVRVWEQPVTIDTYEPHLPDRNPMFLENRVYQGSSGRVYPLPLIERIEQCSRPRLWRALHIENEFVRVMVLPELGGRIHIGLDKTNGYDFFYRQDVIKPALVGLAGPWASGGVEFNWPQHHRPATYMPVQTHIEQHANGAATLWCSDHDPFQRMKGAHGVCLHPGRSLLELKVRLYNRTNLRETFLWWANAATRVHELYQSFFPPDVHFVADHAERAMSAYPLCAGIYYGVDYARRAVAGIPPEERPPCFAPPGTYASNDLRWYANIPVPTSYMAMHSEADFFGGYDHARQAGVVHVANHHIAPGKKQWTWGNHEFGYSWDRQLTDSDGPYIELMAGVYTDNQPDFSFIEPGETKTFSQFWYPIRDIGVVHAANTRAACHVERADSNHLRVALHATENITGARVQAAAQEVWTGDIGPAHSIQFEVGVPSDQTSVLVLSNAEGDEILRYDPSPSETGSFSPEPATEPPMPSDVEMVEELFLIGQHLEQYRHATRDPIDYWKEALLRDPGESRCLEAVALWRLRRGEFGEAETLLRSALKRLTRYNGNPPKGSAFYHLGLVQRFLGQDKEAYDSLYKATWNFSLRSAAFRALAEIDAARGRFTEAVAHLAEALRTNADDLRARSLQVLLLRQLGREHGADQLLQENTALDPTDAWTVYLLTGTAPADNQMLLDMAFDYARAGLFQEAGAVCERANFQARDGSVPMVFYTLAYLSDRRQRLAESEAWLKQASSATPDYCFPSRLEELIVLQWAIARERPDARAHYYLGNLLYDKRRYEEAISAWEKSVRGDNFLATPWRNLGIAYYNVRNEAAQARDAFERAFSLNQNDARVFFERDQLWKRIHVPPANRLREMERFPELVDRRDDLSIELIDLLNQSGDHQTALHLLTARSFQPWEGGEGLVVEQHVRTHVALGRQALLKHELPIARTHFEAALGSPHNLGEAKHPLANQANVCFWLGETFHRLASQEQATHWWQKAVSAQRDFQELSVKPFSVMSFYRVLAFQRLENDEQADTLIRQWSEFAAELGRSEAKVEYFATSLPNILLFRDDLSARQRVLAQFVQAQSLLAAGRLESGESLLKTMLEMQPNHTAASDLLEESKCLEQLGLYRASPLSANRRRY
jgi:tetratricopeptide (TPR) repeat protein